MLSSLENYHLGKLEAFGVLPWCSKTNFRAWTWASVFPFDKIVACFLWANFNDLWAVYSRFPEPAHMVHKLKYFFFFVTLDVYKRKGASSLDGWTKRKDLGIVCTSWLCPTDARSACELRGVDTASKESMWVAPASGLSCADTVLPTTGNPGGRRRVSLHQARGDGRLKHKRIGQAITFFNNVNPSCLSKRSKTIFTLNH